MKLTSEQLRQNAAAMIAFADGKPIEYQSPSGDWLFANSISNIDKLAHRPKPEPRVRPWNSPADVPGPICWLRLMDRQANTASLEAQIVSLSNTGITWFTSDDRWLPWSDEKLNRLEWSTDRVNWHPCTVTEDQ